MQAAATMLLLCQSESVEQHTVQNRSFAFDFEVLKNLVNLIVEVLAA